MAETEKPELAFDQLRLFVDEPFRGKKVTG